MTQTHVHVRTTSLTPPSRYFWYNSAVQASSHIGSAGVFNWKMFLCLFAAWVLIYLCLFRGIESSGKVLYVHLIVLCLCGTMCNVQRFELLFFLFQIVYFTATFPYVILVCLFFRAVTLEGAGDGLRFLFLPDSSFKVSYSTNFPCIKGMVSN